MKTARIAAFLAVATTFVLLFRFSRADEGMWLYNQFPKQALKAKYGVEPSDEWLKHIRLSSVRFNSGGSGSFVSSTGLVMTNHHVGADALAKMSTEQKDLVKLGYYAKTSAEEIKCVDLELNVLMNIEDVTQRVNEAVKPGQSPADAQLARRGVINTIEKETFDKSGLRSDVVTLFQGGQYHLYQFKKYTDIRLLFAPEKDIAFFGGDPDNFEFPRYDLDVCFFRVYENDKPAKIEHYLKWSKAGAKDGELAFVSGHPGRTSRLNTVAHLEFYRDKSYPMTLNLLRRYEVLMKTYSDRSTENDRQAQAEYFGVQNGRKAFLGMLAALQDPAVMAKKRADEKALRDAVMKDEDLKKQYGGAWDDVAASIKAVEGIYLSHMLLEAPARGLNSGRAFNTHLFGYARTLLRLAQENQKPNSDRLREYRESNLASLRQQLFSTAPVYEDFEVAKLADALSLLAEIAGADGDAAKKILDG